MFFLLKCLKFHNFTILDLPEKLVNKRELKRQGILERMKNKMDHDLSKYGWD